MSEALAAPREGSLVQHAIDAVASFIRSEKLRVGDSLPGEGHFATSLGVSRPVMREAFGALAALRLIEVSNGRRPRVGAMDGSAMATTLNHAVSTAQVSVPEVWDVRRTVEARTATLAATYRSEAEAQHILHLAERMDASRDDFEALTGHDIAFHETIARASHNALFHQIVCSFAPLMKVAVPAAWRTRAAEEARNTMIQRHRAVARAIALKDPGGAETAMNAHFDQSVGDLLKATAGGE